MYFERREDAQPNDERNARIMVPRAENIDEDEDQRLLGQRGPTDAEEDYKELEAEDQNVIVTIDYHVGHSKFRNNEEEQDRYAGNRRRSSWLLSLTDLQPALFTHADHVCAYRRGQSLDSHRSCLACTASGC